MSFASIARTLVALVGVCLCVIFSRPPEVAVSEVTLEILPNPLVLKVLGRSQQDFVADLFWVRMANMAGRCVKATECGALLPIANLIADLSPKFKYPYFVGGVMAPVRIGKTDQYANADGALALMTRGAKEVPDYVRLHVQKAYTELELFHDPAAAGRTLMNISRVPGAPAHLAGLATRLLNEAGQFDDALAFAQTMANSEDPNVREDFELRLKLIELERTLARVDEAAARYTTEKGQPPASVEALVAEGFLPFLPSDPFGGRIELGVTGGARSTVEERRLRAFTPPGG
jgi:hypothetical protein